MDNLLSVKIASSEKLGWYKREEGAKTICSFRYTFPQSFCIDCHIGLHHCQFETQFNLKGTCKITHGIVPYRCLTNLYDMLRQSSMEQLKSKVDVALPNPTELLELSVKVVYMCFKSIAESTNHFDLVNLASHSNV